MHRIIPALAAIMITASSCIKENVPQGADLQIGDALPEFTVTMADGSFRGTADLLGSVSCVVFFHTGCPDCQKTMPLVQRLYDNYSAEGSGEGADPDKTVEFLCISREEGNESIAAYWAENGFTLNYSAQEDRAIYNLFATWAVPRIYICDREGIITAIHTDNPLVTYEELDSEVLAIL